VTAPHTGFLDRTWTPRGATRGSRPPPSWTSRAVRRELAGAIPFDPDGAARPAAAALILSFGRLRGNRHFRGDARPVAVQ
jgi:hypothetical protein